MTFETDIMSGVVIHLNFFPGTENLKSQEIAVNSQKIVEFWSKFRDELFLVQSRHQPGIESKLSTLLRAI